MPSIISSTSISQEQIAKNLTDYKNSLPNAQEIKDDLNSSAISTITQLSAGVASWLLYYLNQTRKETYLSTALQEDSIYYIAKMFGYNMTRALCPQVKLIYNEIPTITLKCGDILGTYNDLDLVYFGKQRIIEKGDEIPVCIGKFKTVSRVIQKEVSESIVQTLEAEELDYIDNDNIQFMVGNREVTVSRDVEEYIVLGSVIDFTINPKSLNIYIADFKYNYGLQDIADDSTYTINYLETSGQDLSIKMQTVSPNKEYIVSEVLTTGADPEKPQKIKENSPFYYSTLRRAVTLKEYTYLGKAHSLVEDVCAVEDKGTPLVFSVSLKASSVIEGQNYSIGLKNDIIYTIRATKDETVKSLLEAFTTSINNGGWATAEYDVDSRTITITNTDARNTLNPTVSSHFNTPKTIKEQVAPPCCTVYLYYIRSGQTRTGDILIMSDSEKLTYGKYIQSVKCTGTTIILIPATRIQYDIYLKVELHDYNMKINGQAITDYIKEQAEKIIRENFEFRIGQPFYYYEMVAAIAQIEVEYNNQIVTPIKSIEQNHNNMVSPAKDIELDGTQYIVVPTLNIKFIGR